MAHLTGGETIAFEMVQVRRREGRGCATSGMHIAMYTCVQGDQVSELSGFLLGNSKHSLPPQVSSDLEVRPPPPHLPPPTDRIVSW